MTTGSMMTNPIWESRDWRCKISNHSVDQRSIIDTRARQYITRTHDIMEGVVWRDPERINERIGELSKTNPVVPFCLSGFHIGCETAETLRKVEGNEGACEAVRVVPGC